MSNALMPLFAIFALAACAIAASPATTRPAVSAWTIRGNLPPEQFIIQSHRGAGELSEENTPEAFELGWRLGTIPEADVRTTKDGVIVAFHDKNFARVVKDASEELKTKGVEHLTFAELSKLDVGSWKGEQFAGRRVSRMSDIFSLMKGKPDRRLYLDIKLVDFPQLAAEVKSAGVEAQVILASTKYEQIREWRRHIPQGQTLLWMGGTEEKLRGRLEELRKAGFADVTQVQIHTHLKGDPSDAKRDSVDPFKESDGFLIEAGNELRQRGILFQTLPYGGSTKEIYWKLLDLGLMSFATDHPDVTRDAVKAYYEAK
ncbi:MAG: glycerophosphodiester phosphodiesterase family protein [Tepidisphaeraceae bacterium]